MCCSGWDEVIKVKLFEESIDEAQDHGLLSPEAARDAIKAAKDGKLSAWLASVPIPRHVKKHWRTIPLNKCVTLFMFLSLRWSSSHGMLL